MKLLFLRTCRLRRRRFGKGMLTFVLGVTFTSLLFGQNETIAGMPALKGVVRDSHGNPVPNATVSLRGKSAPKPMTTRTDAQGVYNFAALAADTYSLQAELPGRGHAQFGPFALGPNESKSVDLTLTTDSAAMPEFFDEPQFTVAGVTQAGSGGAHGPDTIQRTSDALAKATVSLNKPTASLPAPNTADLQQERDELRKQLARSNRADSHHQLAEVEEKLSNPLEAVREYQRAAEMEPSETHLFDWGAELLSHRAFEPASEVFTKGHRLFPKSSRMLMGLGVAHYGRGTFDKAAHSLCEASDLNPVDPAPYLFLGKMLVAGTVDSQGVRDKLARFAALEPDNALANYYYAMSLTQPAEKSGEKETNSEPIQALLEKSIRLDPNLGAAHLQLGIILGAKGEEKKSIAEYQKAVESDPDLLQAHYRLARAYRQTGQSEKAQQEFELYRELLKKRDEQSARERHEMQQFVITMREGASGAQPQQ